MKNKIISITFLILFFLSFIPNVFAIEDEIIDITDEILKSKLISSRYYDGANYHELDENNDGEISKSEIQKLDSLSFGADEKLPNDFSVLKYATSLKTLHISGLNLESMSKLSELTSLTEIWYINGFDSQYTIDLEGIENLTNLKNLTITNKVKNVEKIGALLNLESLNLTYSDISDISFAQNLINLTYLNLSNNNITDFSSVQSLNSLKNLILEHNNIEEISTIPTNLEYLSLSNNTLKSFTLKDNSKLKSIAIGNNEIVSINLENLSSLENLYMQSNKISEINLTGVNNLKTLNITDNNITDIGFLSNLDNLTSVYLNANEINPEEGNNKEVLTTLKEKGVTVEIDEYSDAIGLEFKLNSEETGYIVSKFRGYDITKVEVPSTYENLPVVEIGDEAFYNAYYKFNIEEITLPETIVKIGYRAFANCTKLKSINIPEGVTSIGKEAFEYCRSLENIKLPNGLTVISYGLFFGCDLLENVIIPESVKDIKPAAFQQCISITEMIIPDSVIYLGNNGDSSDGYEGSVFSGCTNLRKITLSKNITKIDHNTFAGCESLETLSVPEGVTIIDGCTFGRCISLKKLVLPRSFNKLEEESKWLVNSGFNPTIYGYKETMAEKMAISFGLEFVALDDYTKENLEAVKVDDENVTIIPVSKESTLDYINEANFPIKNDYIIEILDKDGNEIKQMIGSKSKIKITDKDGNIFAEFTVVVAGDVTGNGHVRMYDSFEILKGAVTGNKGLDEIDYLIRDYNQDGNIRMYDAFQYLREAVSGK